MKVYTCVCVCVHTFEWMHFLLSMWQYTRWKSAIEREAVIYVRGLIAEDCVCWGIITGRPRLHAAASLSFLFDDVPHHKALNTQMRRLRGRVEMGEFWREVRWAGPFHKEI